MNVASHLRYKVLFFRCIMQSIPNAISALRILLTPVLVFCLFQQTLGYALYTLILFVLGAVSDFADGYVARAFNKQSQLGRYLDPLADKVLVLGTFAGFAWIYPQQVPWWAVGIIALRDAWVTGLRLHAESMGISLPTIRFAKVKTVVQFVFLGGLLLLHVLTYLPATKEFASLLWEGSVVAVSLVLVVIITCMTGLHYVRLYLHKIHAS